jgi:hypothetical protein
MAITRDGKTLYVASFRSGKSVRFPYPDSPADSQRDIAVVDTASLKTVRYVGDIGTTLQQILLSPDESKLFITRLVVNTRVPLAAPGNQSFGYEVAALDVATGSVVRSRGFQPRTDVPDDLPLVTPVGIALDKNSLWVAFEASDTVVQLGLDDFSELKRFAAPGRPRSVLVSGDRVVVHGPQNFSLTLVDGASGQTSTVKLSETDRWGEPLGRMIDRVLTEDLVRRLPNGTVFAESGAISARPDTVLEVDIQRLDADPDGSMVLLAQIAIRPEGRPANARVVRLAVPISGLTAAGHVAAMSAAIAQLADAVVADLARL